MLLFVRVAEPDPRHADGLVSLIVSAADVCRGLGRFRGQVWPPAPLPGAHSFLLDAWRSNGSQEVCLFPPAKQL